MENLPLKQKRGQILQKKSEAIEKIQLERKRSVEFGGASIKKATCSSGHISSITIGSCLFFNMFFFSNASTN